MTLAMRNDKALCLFKYVVAVQIEGRQTKILALRGSNRRGRTAGSGAAAVSSVDVNDAKYEGVVKGVDDLRGRRVTNEGFSVVPSMVELIFTNSTAIS